MEDPATLDLRDLRSTGVGGERPKPVRVGRVLWRRGFRRRALLCGLGFGLALTTACARIQLAMREPGEANKSMPADVAEEYHCDQRPLPFFKIERNELLPERARPGQEMGHRIVYVLCPRRPTEVVSGKLDTRILFKGHSIFREVIEQDLKPGRWVIDTLIPLPADAEPGVYALEVDFTSRQGNLDERSDFVVKAK